MALLKEARAGQRTLVMGVLNVTPDSFSDGGRFCVPELALEHAIQMVQDGADIIDIGGESTRPGAEPQSEAAESARVLPIIEQLSQAVDVPISIDTTKARVAELAIAAGATMINDISAMTFDADMSRVAAESGAPICLMHIQGTPRSMQHNPTYCDVVTDVRGWLALQCERALAAGISPRQIVVDPGFGFGKSVEHNLELIRRLREIAALGYPVLVGPSRKSTIGSVLGGLPPEERIEGTAALVALAIANGASIVRVHDVREMSRAARMTDAVVHGYRSP